MPVKHVINMIANLCCDHSDKASHDHHVRNMMAGERTRFFYNRLATTFPHMR